MLRFTSIDGAETFLTFDFFDNFHCRGACANFCLMVCVVDHASFIDGRWWEVLTFDYFDYSRLLLSCTHTHTSICRYARLKRSFICMVAGEVFSLTAFRSYGREIFGPSSFLSLSVLRYRGYGREFFGPSSFWACQYFSDLRLLSSFVHAHTHFQSCMCAVLVTRSLVIPHLSSFVHAHPHTLCMIGVRGRCMRSSCRLG